jgi:hypothetical protein
MKTALLWSGNPRFSVDLDSQLENLQNSEVDVFIVFWKREYGWDPKVSKNWSEYAPSEIKSKLSPFLPKNFNIKHIEILDPNSVIPPREYEPHYSTPKNVWQQYKCLQHCDHVRRRTDNYALVVRSRTDIGLSEPIDLKLAYDCLKACSVPLIYTPKNQRYGYYPNFNDQFAIGLPKIMNLYCDAVDSFDRLYNQGTKYNPEYLVQTFLSEYGVQWPETSFEILRNPEHWVPINHGKWENL